MSLTAPLVVAVVIIGAAAMLWSWKRDQSQKVRDAYAQSLGHDIVVGLAMDLFEGNWGMPWKNASDTHRERAIDEARALLATALPLVEGYVVDKTIDKAFSMFDSNEMYPLTTQRVVDRLRSIKEEGITA